MEKFTQLTGVAAPLPIVNLDTDKIFPAVYLKTIKRTGLSQWLFQEIRFKPDGSENPDFVLNQAPYRKAQILIGAENFGCGSSREHAPLGAPGFRHPLCHRAELCRHLLQSLLQERHSANE